MISMKKYIFPITGRKIAVAIAALFIVIFGAWFFFIRSGDGGQETLVVKRGDFIQQVSVSGTVKATQDVDLGFAQSGRVSGAYVAVGDSVKAGALIAEIENGDLRASVAQKQAALEAAQATLASLEAGTRPEEIAVTQSEVASDESALALADQALVDAIRSAYTDGDDAIRNTVDAFISNPNSNTPQIPFLVTDQQYEIAVESGRVAVGATLSTWQSDMAQLTAGTATHVAPRTQTHIALVAAFMSTVNAALNHGITTQSTTQADINGWITDVGAARAALDGAASSLTTAQTARTAAAAALDKAKKNLALEQAGTARQDIDAEKAHVAGAQADLANARAQLRKTLVVTPFDGTVTKMDAKVGETVSPDMSKISMISGGIFQIECFVPEINVALVKVGDSAAVTLDAYGEALFDARVLLIDLAETVRDGVSTYRAILQFAERDPRIRSGMTANVRIMTEKKENVISIPQRVVTERDGKKFVLVKEGGVIIEKVVTTGSISSSGQIEILSGLGEGDVVMLSQ